MRIDTSLYEHKIAFAARILLLNSLVSAFVLIMRRSPNSSSNKYSVSIIVELFCWKQS